MTDGPVSARVLYDSALRPTADSVFVATDEDKRKLWEHCESEAARLNDLIANDAVLRAKVSAGKPFTMSIDEPNLRPYVSHILHQPNVIGLHVKDPDASS